MAGSTSGKELIAEFVGTFLLVFTVGCNVLSHNVVWAGVSIGCVLMVSIYALGCISGANFNPAVSFALAMSSSMGLNGCDFAWSKFAWYTVVQLLAGLFAAVLYTALFADTFNLSPSPGFGWINACLCEIFYTFMLCFVVLNVAVSKSAQDAAEEMPGGNQFYGLAIGFVIVAGAYGAGAVSGGCFNPAVALGIDTASLRLGFGYCIPYFLSEFLGAALAAALFRRCRPTDFGETPEFTLVPKLCAEFIGTYILVLTVGLNVMAASPAAVYSIAASLMCMIYALGDVSGAHFNPAVTIAIVSIGQLNWKKGGWYILVQILGGFVASWSYVLVWAGNSFSLAPEPRWTQIAFAEGIFTAVLVFVVLCVACSGRTDTSKYFGLAIGSCVTVGGLAIGKISGGSLNPAVSLGIAMGDAVGNQGNTSWGKAMLFTIFEVVGALVAAGAFAATYGIKPAKAPKKKKPESNEAA